MAHFHQIRPAPVAEFSRILLPFAAPHLVGIAGSGMKSLGELLGDLGCRVTGSDQRLPGGHCESNVAADCDALVYSPAIPPDNPERAAAAALGIPQYSLVDVLAKLMETRTGVCIAGTHGKSTTTALTAWVLQHAGREPSAFIGASIGLECGDSSPLWIEPPGSFCADSRTDQSKAVKDHRTPKRRGGWAGTGDLFVVESCEYRRHFLQLTPRHSVILNIEPDHFDTFPDEAALLEGFREFAQRVPPTGTLLVSGDCERCRWLDSRDFGKSLESFGSLPHCDWRFTDVERSRSCQLLIREPEAGSFCYGRSHSRILTNSATGTRFRVLHRNRFVMEIESPLFGDHNLHNVLAAVALCLRLGISPREIHDAVRVFPGITRRFARIGARRGVEFFDDYAHHPTAVRVTLETARQRFAGRRVWCVFQPHQLTRTQRLLDDFATSLAVADCVLITPVFAAREEAGSECERVARLLVERTALAKAESGKRKAEGTPSIPKLPPSAFRLPPSLTSLDRILPTLDDGARPGDVVILMGAGDIERIGRHVFDSCRIDDVSREFPLGP